MGRLTKKAHRQPPVDTMAAPSDGPVAAANAPTPPHNATIWVRRPGGYAPISSAPEAGTKNAAPAPCKTRLAPNAGTFGAMPHRNEPTTNTASPRLNVRRLPLRSPVRPPVTSSAPKTIEYAVIPHASDA